MAAYFECSNCRKVTPIQTTPPRCPVCGRAHGMILSRATPEETAPAALPVPEIVKQ